MNTQTVVTRFAPSPTGFLHVGGVRTALFSYLYAKQHNGKYILRIEDTDKVRSTKAYEQDILDGLTWLGLEGEEVYKQSERTDIHKEYLEKLIKEDKAYVSKEAVVEEGGRAEVIRFRNPNKKVTFTDLIRGEVTFDTTELGDFVIAKSLEEPIFHFVVVLDDFLMGITHVIRGEDHISNTPRQILIQEALGAPRPIYAHLPLILAEDRSKLSKRKHGEKVSLKHYIDLGYTKEAIINFMALLGWNPGDDREVLSLEELIRDFNISKVQKGGAIFNVEKLNWLNREYIKRMSPEELLKNITPKFPEFDTQFLTRAVPAIIDRISVFGDIDTFIASGEFSYFTKPDTYTTEQLLWKGKQEKAVAQKHLEYVVETLQTLPEYPTAEAIKTALWDYATEHGKGDVLWPTRYAVTGKDKSPDPFIVISIIGTTEAKRRLQQAINMLS